MDSTLIVPSGIAFPTKVAQEEPKVHAASSENIFDLKLPLGLAVALVAPASLSVLLCGVLAVLSALNIIPMQ